MPLADRSRPGVTAQGNAQPAALSPVRALLLGGLHGPAELLPISSSGHIALLPWLLGWEEPGDAELEKAFEVALHAGTALALLLALRGEVGTVLRDLRPQRLALIGLSCLPPALVGLGLERPIERRLGTPPTIAVGLLGGAVAMAWSDRAPQARDEADAKALDALWLGIAQACALVPGVSRGGATLSTARRRRFTRPAAGRLSRHSALPVIVGASTLKGWRLSRRGLPAGAVVPLAAGATAAFLSTLASVWIIRRADSDRSLLPYAVYRTGLAAIVIGRIRAARRSGAHPDPRHA